MRRASLTACVVAAALLAGCGGGGGGGGGGSGGRTKVTVQDVAGIPSDFLVAGVKQGFFADHGLDVTVEKAAGGAAIIPAVVSGNIQFGGSNLVSTLLAASKGLPIQLVGPGTFGPETKKDAWAAILVRRDSAIRTPKDLEGKTMAVNTLKNVATETATAALRNLGADPSTVKFTEVDFPDMLSALQARRVDAIFEIEPFVTAGLAQGFRRVVYPYYATKPGLEIGSYVASRDYVQEHADVVKAFQAGLADTARFVTSKPDAFRRVLAAEGVKGADKITLPTWKEAVSRASLQEHARIMQQQGLIGKAPPLDRLLAPGAAG